MARSEALIKAQTKFLLSRKRLTLTLTPDEYNRIKGLAEKKKMTLRELVMKAIKKI